MKGPVEQAAAFLVAARNSDGGWGYSPRSGQSAPEPSCYSLLALRDLSPETCRNGLAWLESEVRSDGSVRLEGDDENHWSTSLAVLTLSRLGGKPAKLQAAITRLLLMKGSRDSNVGWAWNDQTYSWVEPTCYAVLALKAAGQRQHPRVLDAERMLESRVCVGGGWNQGLRVSFHKELAALPAQTALAMLALQDRAESRASVTAAGRFLISHVESQPSTLSLAWAILGLHATRQGTGRLPAELERRQAADGSWRGAVHLTALALLALRAMKEEWNAFGL